MYTRIFCLIKLLIGNIFQFYTSHSFHSFCIFF